MVWPQQFLIDFSLYAFIKYLQLSFCTVSLIEGELEGVFVADCNS